MARSADPATAPIITPNYLSDPADARVLAAGMRFTREIFAAPAIAQHSVEEIVPGPRVQTDEEFGDYARNFGNTIYHPVGTCKMGHDADPDAVLDTALRVRGTHGLRVVDASLMPTIVSGNTNAAVLAAAGKAADLILA